MELNLYPQAIAELELKGLALKNEAQSFKDTLDGIKKHFVSEIADEVKEDGKKMFSNAEARDIELSNRLKEDPEYQTVQRQLSEIETERAKNDIALEKVKGEFSVARYILRQTTAKQMEQASIHFAEGLQILLGLGTLLKGFSQNPPSTDDEIDF